MTESQDIETPHFEPDQIESIRKDEAGQLVLRVRGREDELKDVRVARCFPWSLPGAYISIRTPDGHELCLLKRVEDLPEAWQGILRAELADKIFNPRILKVLTYKNEFGVANLRAATDRGEVNFQIRSRDDVRVLSPTRALLRDVDGNTYELADLATLDPASRKHFHAYF